MTDKGFSLFNECVARCVHLAQAFPVNFLKFLRTPFLQNTSGRLLLTLTEINESGVIRQKKDLSGK